MQDICLYCYSIIEDFTDTDIPEIDAEVAWAKLREAHAEGCAWIRTRAWMIVEEDED